MSAPAAILFNLQRFSTEDGPGIRTTVFLKGCPLRCAWCHNPEGLRPGPELVWYDGRCIAARDCLAACPTSALAPTAQGLLIDRARCTACGDCARVCPSAALEVIGTIWTATALLGEILKDRPFFETSGGGVTFSGGEPMLQAPFLAGLLPLCKEAGLHVALDTCGLAPWEDYQALLPFIDLVLLDLKLLDPARHAAATGVDNELILANARRFAASGAALWVRTPVIPGFTADAENIRQIAGFIQRELPALRRWDLLAYTDLARPKYRRLGRPYRLEQAGLLSHAEMQAAWSVAVEQVPVARWSGATRLS